jgi:hypothetical protein
MFEVTHAKTPAGVIFAVNKLLLDLKNLVRSQKGVHLLLGSTAVTDGYGKESYLHG